MDLFEPWRNAPPARYTLESDSEDEADPEDGEYRRGGASTSARAVGAPAAELRLAQTASVPLELEGCRCIVALEEAGRAWADGFDCEAGDGDALQQDGELLLNDKKVASLSIVPTGSTKTAILFFAGELTYEAMHAVSDEILSTLKPSSLTLIDAYSAPSYLSHTSSSPSLRYLATPSLSPGFPPDGATSALEPFEPPNLVQGLAAALAGGANDKSIPTFLLLFPSSLSDSTSGSLGSVGSGRRQPVPEQIYDFGGPSEAASTSSMFGASAVQTDLRAVANALEWGALGWSLPNSGSPNGSRPEKRAAGRQAGFGWWKEERRSGQREIGEGGMYI